MKPTRNLWPLGIVAAIGLFIAGTVGLIVLAASRKSDLVSRDYYEQEIRYQAEIDSARRAGEFGGRAAVAFDDTTRCLTVTVPAEHVRDGLTGRIQLYRPSAAGQDQELALAPDATGRQSVPLAALLPGLWKVRVSWACAGQHYLLERKITNSVALAGKISSR